MPLSTCLTHSSAECSLPCQGRSEAQETTRRSEHLAAHHERTPGFLGENTTNRAGINVSTAFLCLGAGKAKVKECPPSPLRSAQLALLRVPLLFKRLPAKRFPTRTWSSVYCASGSPAFTALFFYFKKNISDAHGITLVHVLPGSIQLYYPFPFRFCRSVRLFAFEFTPFNKYFTVVSVCLMSA